MKLHDFLLNLLFPPTCVFCKETLPYYATDALCPLCRSRYEAEKGFSCPECGKPHSECTCVPTLMKRHSETSIHIAEYVKEESAARAMILAAKDSSYAYLYRFLAQELASAVKKRLGDCEAYLVTYVPRSRSKIARCGVDQAREASKRLARELECEFAPLFSHTETQEQKALSTAERARNAKDAYALLNKRKDLVVGRNVILYDDVVTTGATMSACAALLKKAGAAEIVYLSFGKTYRKKSKDKGSLPRSKKRYRIEKNCFV